MKHKNISEGVLDVTDEEGWLAKSQLYKIAKYAGELHAMIADTDELEPWMQAKITKAADYMGAVKHYIEYNMVSTEIAPMAEPMAEPMVPEPEMVPMESTEKEVNEANPKDWKKAKGRGRYPRKMDQLEGTNDNAEENALDEDAELQATAREFMGNALLKILDNQTNENKENK